MNPYSRLIAAAALALTASVSLAQAEPAAISPAGQRLAAKLDSLGVEGKWTAGVHVDWDSGLPDGAPETEPGRHTHCSAFVASAAKSLGVYILRPPQHEQALLANAQNEWLAEAGAANGWRRVEGPLEAQSLANEGYLVVASYHAHFANKPGHIAIVKPAARAVNELESEGPLAIQAGTVNSAAIPIRAGFAGHPHAWDGGEIVYYAHAVVAH
jgi:hypothetical protein